MAAYVTTKRDMLTDPHACKALQIADRIYDQDLRLARDIVRRLNYAARGDGDLRAAVKDTTEEVESWGAVLITRVAALRALARELRQLYDRIETACPRRCRCGAELPRYEDGAAAYCPRCGQKQGEL